MQHLKRILCLFLILLFCITLVDLAKAQDVDVIVTPDEAEVEVGGTIQFEAFAFTVVGHRTPVDVADIAWSVRPDTLASITEDGFFMAGKHTGTVEVRARIVVRNHTFERVIRVSIGRSPRPFFDIKVEPSSAVVPVGSEQQFEVVIRTPSGERVQPKHVRWEVRPENLGKIDEVGLFVASDEAKQGRVVAIVDVDRLKLRASARVVISPPATSAISGNIGSENDGPIEGAVVKAIRLGRIHWVRKVETDSEGNYLIDELIPGFYVVRVSARGFIGEFYDDARNFLEADPVNVAEEDTVAGVDFLLTLGGKIKGTIVTEGDSLPLQNAHVAAILAVKPNVARHVVTDENGDYEIDALPTGSYLIRANAAGYKAEFFDDASNVIEATLVEVEAPDSVENVAFALGPTSAIRGVVVNAVDSSPIADARIAVFPDGILARPHHRALRETRTNEDGEYLVQVRPGRYTVFATARGFNGEFYDDVRDPRQATFVEVFPDSHTTDINFDLVPRGSIAGMVTDQESGEPIAGAVVEAFKERTVVDVANSIAGFRAKTNDAGEYMIENVPAGEYLVRAVAEGYLPEFFKEADNKADAQLVTVEDRAVVDTVDFTLEPGGSISGLVATASDSTPIPRALVRVFEVNWRHFRRTYSNEDGTYSVGGLPSGEYHVQAVAEGFFAEFYEDVRRRQDADSVEVTAPEETSGIDFYLEAFQHRRGSITGRVFSGEDETSIEGAVVIAVRFRNRAPHYAFTGPRGFYSLTNLFPGKYFVFAVAEGFVGEFYDNAQFFQDAEPVFVRNGEVTEGIDFGLKARTRTGVYAVRGNIRSAETNEPVEGVLVNARLGDEIEVNATTDVEGNYVITELPAGEYKIEATAVGFEPAYFGGTNQQNAASVVVNNGEDATEINLNLETDNVTRREDEVVSSVPETYELFQNYPNPFNPETTIKYQLSNNSEVTLKIFNMLGQEIITLVDKQQDAGVYSVRWDGKDKFGQKVASGIYIFQLKAGDGFRFSKRMILLK